MQVNILRSKILRAQVTHAHQHYEGSLAIDSAFMEKVDMLPYEKVLVGNITNGNRFETYAIPAEKGSRIFGLNGATAHLGKPGDLLVVMSFASVSEKEARNWKPKVLVLADANQRIVSLKRDESNKPV